MNKSVRIAVVMPKLGRYGGAEGFAWRLADALAQKGYAVDFLCARVEEAPPAGVRPLVVGRFGIFRTIKVIWFALAVEFVQRQNQYDLVIGLGNTIHQDIARVGGGPIRAFNRLSIRAWPAGLARKLKAVRRFLSPAGRAIAYIDSIRMKRAKSIVAVSDFVRELILQTYPSLDKSSVKVIYNQPDLARFSPGSAEERKRSREGIKAANEHVVIATAGTNFMLKGIPSLIKALSCLPEHFVLHVAGGRNAAACLRLAKSLGVEHRVHFHGRVSDMVSFYRATDVFVLASFFDACSNAVLEAEACGCRVLSSAMNGSARFLDSKYVFADPAQYEDLASLIEQTALEATHERGLWPSTLACGLSPYLDLVEQCLSNRK